MLTAAWADDEDGGGRLYEPCAACHGSRAEGNAQVEAPALAGLPEWYISRQLRNFRTERRGTDEADLYGGQMARMALQLWDDGEVKRVAAYISSLERMQPPRTLRGKASRGEAAYAPCAACHGAAAEGNEEIGAPPLVNLGDWYIAKQLAAFRSGKRGAHIEDAFGQQMRAAAATLADDRSAQEVAAYIGSLAKPK